MPLALRCVRPTQGRETSCILEVIDCITSSSVFSLADHLFFSKTKLFQASSMSSGGTLSPRQQEGSYFRPQASCHSFPSHSLVPTLRIGLKLTEEEKKKRLVCEDVSCCYHCASTSASCCSNWLLFGLSSQNAGARTDRCKK